jgi:hypothetical protein
LFFSNVCLQGRLKLALEEVLVMSLDPATPDSPTSSSSSMGAGSEGYLAIKAAAAANGVPAQHSDLQQQQQGVALADLTQQQQQRIGEQLHWHPDSRPAAAAAAAADAQQQQRAAGVMSHQLHDELLQANSLSDSDADLADAAESAAAAAAAAAARSALPSVPLLTQQQQQPFAAAAAAATVSAPLPCVTEEAASDLLSDGSISSNPKAIASGLTHTAAAGSSSSSSALQHQHRVRRLPLLKPATVVKQQGCGLDAVAGGSKSAALRVLLAEDNAINVQWTCSLRLMQRSCIPACLVKGKQWVR